MLGGTPHAVTVDDEYNGMSAVLRNPQKQNLMSSSLGLFQKDQPYSLISCEFWRGSTAHNYKKLPFSGIMQDPGSYHYCHYKQY